MSEEITGLSPAALLLALHADLEPWVAEREGKLSIAGDPGAVLEALSDAPKNFRVVLAWEGDEDQTNEAEVGIVDNTFAVWLIKANGLRNKPGDHLVHGTEENPAFLETLAALRQRVRSQTWPDDLSYGRVQYKGAKPFPSPELAYDLPTTGFVMRFALTTVVPWEELRAVEE